MSKCEDFPACGHYEETTGSTFCGEFLENERRASLSEEDKAVEDATARIRAQFAAERARAERRAIYNNAADEHSEACDADEPSLCKGCLEEVDWQEQAMRDYDDYVN